MLDILEVLVDILEVLVDILEVLADILEVPDNLLELLFNILEVGDILEVPPVLTGSSTWDTGNILEELLWPILTRLASCGLLFLGLSLF